MKAADYASIKLPRTLVNWLKQEAAKQHVPMYVLVQRLIQAVNPRSAARREEPLPTFLHHLFWEVRPRQVSLRKHCAYIIQRVISTGNLEAIAWLRGKIGDAAIRDEIIACHGRGFTASQAAPWISRAQHDTWTAEDPNRTIWVPDAP